MIADRQSIMVRPYCDEDWAKICSLHDRARLVELESTVGVEVFRSLEDTYADEGLFDDKLRVAEVEGDIVGFVAFDTDEVTWLYVDPNHYRKGIGRTLLRNALEATSGQIRIELLEGNSAALGLYTSEGFEIVERCEGRLVGNAAFAASGLVLKKYT